MLQDLASKIVNVVRVQRRHKLRVLMQARIS